MTLSCPILPPPPQTRLSHEVQTAKLDAVLSPGLVLADRCRGNCRWVVGGPPGASPSLRESEARNAVAKPANVSGWLQDRMERTRKHAGHN